MKKTSTISKALMAFAMLVIFTTKVNTSFGQIASYVDDTLGALSMVDPNATGTPLARVNGALLPVAICQNGFSTRYFTTATSTPTFSDTCRAIEVTVTPNASHTLNVTGFVADLRRSNTGPTAARYAYSVDGGTTWTDQGTDQTPMHAGCDTLTTCTWATSFTVMAPNTLKFRVYGYLASSTGGTFQIKNLNINGTVTGTTATEEVIADKNNISIAPNPTSQNTNISYHVSSPSNVNIAVYNLLGQEVSNVVNNVMQQAGDFSFPATINTPGTYFVRITIGNETFTKRVEKI